MLNNESLSVQAGPRIFKYEQVGGFIIWMLIVDAFFLFMAISQLIEGRYLATLFFTCALLFFIWGEIISLKVVSDVIIESDKISRSLFGKIWISICWCDINSIKFTNILNSKSYNILGKNNLKHNRLCKITFDNRILAFDGLVDLMSTYANKYSINIISI